MKTARIPVEKIEPDPENPRKHFDAAEITALGKNILVHGQQVPVIVYQVGDKFRLADGARRLMAAKESGIADLMALVHPSKPDEVALRMSQLSLEVHKAALSPMERSDLLVKIRDEAKLSVTELAERLQMSPALVSKLVALQKLAAGIKPLLQNGRLDMEKAYLIAGEPDHERQLALIGESGSLSREQLRSKVRRNPVEQPKAKRVAFALPGKCMVTVQGDEMTLDEVIEKLGDVVKELKKGLAQGLDVTTAQAVMRDKAK